MYNRIELKLKTERKSSSRAQCEKKQKRNHFLLFVGQKSDDANSSR